MLDNAGEVRILSTWVAGTFVYIGGCVNALFWWEPTPETRPGPTLCIGDLQAAFGATSAAFLGRGAFGETWRVGRPLQGDCAVKIILDEHYPEAYLRREVEGLRRLNDSRVVALQDVAIVDLPMGSRPALVFEFVDGGDVASRIESHEWPTFDEAHTFSRELLGAVTELHAVETLHRDIKPENVALRSGSWTAPVLLDLGLAKLLNAESLTQYPALMGTLPYMAPEQVQQQEARKTADVWAVGVVAHMLLAHEHPFFDGRSTPVLADEALERMRRGPRPLPTGVPETTAAVVRRLLAFEPHERGSASRAYRELGGSR